MKNIRQSVLAAGALALAAFGAPAQAAPVPAPANGDIFLGVRATGGQGAATSYLVNLGSDATYRSAAAGSTVTLSAIGDIAKDLAATYGSNWQSREDLQWGIFGTSISASSTVYGSRKQDPVGTFAAAWPALDLTSRNGTSSVITGVLSGVGGYRDGVATANSTVGTFQINSTSSSSYSKQVGADGTTDFGSLSQWLSIEGHFGVANSALDLFRVDSLGVSNLGTFQFKASGQLIFTAHIESNAAPVIKFAEAGYAVTENGGNAVLTLVRLGDVSNAVSVQFSTGGGTAVAGTDYTARSNVVVNFAANQSTATATVPILNRAGFFASRTFNVSLASATGATIVGPSVAAVTISDVGELAFSSAGVSVRALTEGSPTLVSLAVIRSGITTGAATVDVSISGGTLVSGTDYDAFPTTTVAFTDGETSKPVTLQLHGIAAGSLPGTINFALSNPTGGAALGAVSGTTVTVLPNNGEIAFTDAAYSVPALNASNSPSLVTLTLSRSNGSVGQVSVDVSVTGGTLAAGTNYTFSSPTTVTFAPGATTASATIQLGNIPGQTGTIELALSNPTGGASLGLAETEVAVFGAAGTVTLGAAKYDVFEEAGLITIPVLRSGGNSGAVSVRISTTDGTAVSSGSNPDFTALNNQLVEFAEGVNSVPVQITIAKTVANEPNETFSVALSSPVGTTISPIASATVRILDTDTAKPTLTLATPAANAKFAKNTPVSVAGSATDNKGVDKVEVSLNGGDYAAAALTVTAKGVDFVLPISPSRGVNTLSVRSVDGRGNNLVVTRSFVYDDPFPAIAGSYNGLIVATGETLPSNSTSGFLNLTVQATGAFTGKLSIDSLQLSFSGSFDGAGVARFGANKAANISVERPNKPSVVVALSTDLDAPENGKVTGQLTQYYRKILTATSSIDLDRAGFDGKTAATSVASRYLANKGAYTIVFPGDFTPPTGFQPEDYPPGHGFGTITLKANGTLALAGTLSDGTAVTASAPLSKNYEWPLFAQIYNKLGSVGGKLVLNDDNGTHPNDDITGQNLFWFRPYQNVQHYPYGWPEGLTIRAVGAKYDVPTDASVLPGLAATAGHAELSFADGLLPGEIKKDVVIDAKNKVTISNGDKTFTLSIAAATGVVSGTFTHADGSKPAYKGVIFRKGANGGAYGHFLSTAPKVRDGLGEAGAVELKAKAPAP